MAFNGHVGSAKQRRHCQFTSCPLCAITADALVIVTEWVQFRALDLGRLKAVMAQPVVVDLRNVYRPEEMAAAGFVYEGVGRGKV
ncbi:UDP binding domain-containing protein [Tardiphaga sp.]|uniref:UDP binding domain-containing protein n=1 Tax=Tardiphaga sp. TaxID=1926292 RepID=UPI003447D421